MIMRRRALFVCCRSQPLPSKSPSNQCGFGGEPGTQLHAYLRRVRGRCVQALSPTRAFGAYRPPVRTATLRDIPFATSWEWLLILNGWIETDRAAGAMIAPHLAETGVQFLSRPDKRGMLRLQVNERGRTRP